MDPNNQNPNPFQNWREMLSALSEQEVTIRSEPQPRSALMRYQQRRAAHGHGHQLGTSHGGVVMPRSNKLVKCNMCRKLTRKNKHMNRMLKRLRNKLQRRNVHQQSPDNNIS